MSVHVFGIRHHGPGSAASLVQALGLLEPDIVLIEGPPDGDEVAKLASHPAMRPPVALLIYPEKGGSGAYYPFAVFSPEWNALRYALNRNIPVRFIDLPQTHQMAMDLERNGGVDAFGQLAQAAGFEDGELWWESLVEQRNSAEVFLGIGEAMAALRQEAGPAKGREALREAWMRRSIRQAQKASYQNIAVVCGAWHAPVLLPDSWPSASSDEQLLKSLPKCKVEATWVPWTYDRLAFATGYGAGVDSPEYYHLLWEQGSGSDVAVRWMVAAAQLLRAEDLQASPASAVEAVRLAEALAGLRGRPLAGLPELEAAAQAVYCMGVDTPMRLIRRKLVLGERLGEVPEEAPQVPLARDLAALQKRLRLAPEASHRDLDLDLRKPNDRERSRLLHRLNLLQIPWGTLQESFGTGTFRESWRLQWQPEFALSLIQAARWGNTVVEAAGAYISEHSQSDDLLSLTRLAEKVLLADLPQALEAVLARVQACAAVASDPAHLLESLPPFARILRYPDVRQTDTAMLISVVGGLLERIAIGLPLACSSLDEDAAEAMFKRLQPAHGALMTLNQAEWLILWKATLVKLADLPNLNGLIAGRAVWILLDVGSLSQQETSRRLGLVLGGASQAASAAAFVEGFLRDNGELLVHSPDLFTVLEGWVGGLTEDRFIEVLPLLRRTFSSFSAGVRRNLGTLLGTGKRAPVHAQPLVNQRAELVLPLIRQILGVPQ